MLLLELLLLAIGFGLLVKGADWFVEGASGIADKFGIPQLVIGLTIVAMGTSAPEAAVSITAALKGNADITIGNIVGSNILNILIILGISLVKTGNFWKCSLANGLSSSSSDLKGPHNTAPIIVLLLVKGKTTSLTLA